MPGDFAAAAALIDEVEAITQATGHPAAQVRSAVLAACAWRSRAGAAALRVRRRGVRSERGEGSGSAGARWMTALLHNGHGRYGEALAAAREACEHEDVLVFGRALVELIEAGVRCGRPDDAAAALERLSERTQASGTEWALGDRSALPRAGDRRRVALPRVDRAARAQPRGGRARAQPAPVRGVAAAREPTRRTRASSCAPPTPTSAASGPRRSPSGPAANCSPPARPCAGSPLTRAMR